MATYCYVCVNITVANKPLLLRQMLPWWQWSVWLWPLYYAMVGAGNNEFLGESYAGPGILAPQLAPDGLGRAFLSSVDVYTSNAWRCAIDGSTCRSSFALPAAVLVP